MIINRTLENTILKSLHRNKIIVLYGARQVGKTTLIRQVLSKLETKSLEVQGDQIIYKDAFSQGRLNPMLEVVGGHQLLFIDEAQSIPQIGENIKILHDAKPDLKIILTGSSSFELANRTKEALTGRTITFQLHPIAVSELTSHFTPFEIRQLIPTLLRYGSYPEIFRLDDLKDKVNHLRELSQSYLYKDILQLTDIRRTDILHKLLKLLALQMGNLVSLNELSNQLNISFETVRSYIELLEQSFVLKTLSGFSNNPRKEISKMDKIYFVDIGIRNAIINNFSLPGNRNDAGFLWENFLVMERTKFLDYSRDYSQQYFWRKYSGTEIDYIEEKDGAILGYEFKWNKKKSRAGHAWKTDYPQALYSIVNQDNFLKFVG